MKNYILEVFNSKNTSIEIKISCNNLQEARDKTIKACENQDKVILKNNLNGDKWELYRNGLMETYSLNKLS